MLADLPAAIEGLHMTGDSDFLVEAIALRDRLDARIAKATGAFESNGWWAWMHLRR